ncbi:MAG TPA: hypothetical protein VLI93_09435 [Acetobacteraceae bacterium]|nr:hypothetical protein [Acetobacteraceae bacterium]
MERTDNIPADAALLKSGISYANLSPAGKAGMKAFQESAQKLAPLAYRLQGYKYNRVIFDATVNRLSQAIAGQITLDQAYQRIPEDVKQQLAAARQ